jgi:ABC-2 type transport system permease protein
MRNYTWLVRREFWENRAIWIVPTIIGGALTLATLFGRIDINGVVLSDEHRTVVSALMLFGFGVAFFVVMNIYATWYLLDCLYADRKDRSILFWKSLPISDTATVLAKLFTGLIAIPLVYFAAADLSTLLIAFVVSVRARNTFGASLWRADLWLQLQALWLYLIVTTAMWYLPFAGWLIAVSAWAKRAVTLWSVLPPLALYLLERWFFGTHILGSVLVDRTVGYPSHAFRDLTDRGAWVTTMIGGDSITMPGSLWRAFDPIGFLSSPATWGGLAVGALFVAAAIQLRLGITVP